MRKAITIEQGREAITEHFKQDPNRRVHEEILADVVKEWNEKLDDDDYCFPEDFIDWYEEDLIEKCDHCERSIEDDECVTGVDIHGEPVFREYNYAYCPHCGRTASVGTEMTEDGPEAVFGEWE